uniref:F-box and leucine rich repeat protein 12 n=1 Tax=Seriola lalandi dorsalis TaxID=1841481 RepID=A0A3B4YTD4_SERLL
MEEFKLCNLDYFPENILIDVLSFLSVRELVKAGRVCKRWKRLVKDQRLWRHVDLTTWKGVTSRILWVLLRQYLGCGLRCLRLRGLLLSARGGSFLSESWLKALATKCPRLSKLYLLHADLRSLSSCQLLPPSLQVLELRGCELPRKKLGTPSGIPIETLVLNNVPSFTDQHLQSLTSWERLSRLELRDTFRITANGLRSCAAKDGICGVEGLSRLKFLEIGITGRQGYQSQMASLGLGAGWLGLEELSLVNDLNQNLINQCGDESFFILHINCVVLPYLNVVELFNITKLHCQLHSLPSVPSLIHSQILKMYTEVTDKKGHLYSLMQSIVEGCVVKVEKIS